MSVDISHSPEGVRTKLNRHVDQNVSLLSQLTPREQEVSLWVLQGLTNQEISTRLFLAEITIKKHLSNIYAKLGVRNKVQLVKSLLE